MTFHIFQEIAEKYGIEDAKNEAAKCGTSPRLVSLWELFVK